MFNTRTKEGENRTRSVLDGNRVHFPCAVRLPTADMLLFKILLNSVVLTPGAKIMAFNVSNFYLSTPMTRYKYVKMCLADIPDKVVKEYKLHEKNKVTDNDFVYVEVQKGMYGLPQAGILTQQLLKTRLNKRGYYQSTIVPGL